MVTRRCKQYYDTALYVNVTPILSVISLPSTENTSNRRNIAMYDKIMYTTYNELLLVHRKAMFNDN